MKKYTWLILFVLSAFPFFNGIAQSNETTDVSAKILAPISISETRSMHFGTITSGTTSGSCILAPAGTRTASGGIVLSSSTPTAASAAYSVAGNASMTYAITLPSSAVTVTNASASTQTMTVNAFTSSKATGTLSASGTDTFTVGATLAVSANQGAGTYSCTFQVSVAYN